MNLDILATQLHLAPDAYLARFARNWLASYSTITTGVKYIWTEMIVTIIDVKF
ncbi:hypothetical protein [Microcoleus sp. herbarium14]|uniref:hypothetical protein n=1 Tax=Microcoleus sp. herbarium14 TaxID=3055439 RepID=UPI002FD28D18